MRGHAAVVLAAIVAAGAPLRLAAVLDGAVSLDQRAAAHGIHELLQRAGVRDLVVGPTATVEALLTIVRAVVVAAGAGAPLQVAPQVGVECSRSSPEPVLAVPWRPRHDTAPDSALRSVFLQHSLLAELPRLPGLTPIAAKVVVQAVVERLLAVPGGLEPLMLLQRDGELLRRSTRIAVLSVLLARVGGWPADRLADLGAAALLHDLGRVLDDARPGASAFLWLLERGVDDFWLRCALVARHWPGDDLEPEVGAAGAIGAGAVALVRAAVLWDQALQRGVDPRPQLAAAIDRGALPEEFGAVLVEVIAGG